MISVITSTASQKQLQFFKQSVEKTIGVPYELIAIDNSKGQMGLCEVYNIGVKRANYDILCFSHEDVDFKTENWGTEVIGAFAGNTQLGLLGIAGSSYKSLAPSGWAVYRLLEKCLHMNLIQRFKFSEKASKYTAENIPESIAEVVTIDGVWFCCTKKTALKFPFDQQLFKGFHCYDLDFSLQVHSQYMVAVTSNILLEHFSEGSYDKAWAVETVKLHTKWKGRLPLSINKLTISEIRQTEMKAFRGFIQILLAYKFSLRGIWNIIYNSEINRTVGTNNFLLLLISPLLYFVKWQILGNRKLIRKVTNTE